MVVVVLALCVSGCATVIRYSPLKHHHVFPSCADHLPVKVLINVECPPDGICGHTCEPGRWTEGN
jgi:hypothetical protein